MLQIQKGLLYVGFYVVSLSPVFRSQNICQIGHTSAKLITLKHRMEISQVKARGAWK